MQIQFDTNIEVVKRYLPWISNTEKFIVPRLGDTIRFWKMGATFELDVCKVTHDLSTPPECGNLHFSKVIIELGIPKSQNYMSVHEWVDWFNHLHDHD